MRRPLSKPVTSCGGAWISDPSDNNGFYNKTSVTEHLQPLGTLYEHIGQKLMR